MHYNTPSTMSTFDALCQHLKKKKTTPKVIEKQAKQATKVEDNVDGTEQKDENVKNEENVIKSSMNPDDYVFAYYDELTNKPGRKTLLSKIVKCYSKNCICPELAFWFETITNNGVSTPGIASFFEKFSTLRKDVIQACQCSEKFLQTVTKKHTRQEQSLKLVPGKINDSRLDDDNNWVWTYDAKSAAIDPTMFDNLFYRYGMTGSIVAFTTIKIPTELSHINTFRRYSEEEPQVYEGEDEDDSSSEDESEKDVTQVTGVVEPEPKMIEPVFKETIPEHKVETIGETEPEVFVDIDLDYKSGTNTPEKSDDDISLCEEEVYRRATIPRSKYSDFVMQSQQLNTQTKMAVSLFKAATKYWIAKMIEDRDKHNRSVAWQVGPTTKYQFSLQAETYVNWRAEGLLTCDEAFEAIYYGVAAATTTDYDISLAMCETGNIYLELTNCQ